MAHDTLRYWVGRSWLTFFGWKAEGKAPDVPKYVMIAAPHTTNWDLPHMLGVAYVMGFDLNWLGKHTLFEGAKGKFFSWLGGVPVNRTSTRDQVQQIVDHINSVERITLAISPEGTRMRRNYWKSGFYYIALRANIPIACGYLDYGRKVGGVGPIIIPSGDINADAEIIRAFYATVQGKHPEQFNNIAFRPAGEGVERPPKRNPIKAWLHGVGILRAKGVQED